MKTKPKLGRWHWWWLKQFARAKENHGDYDLGVDDWSGTVQGNALAGLMKRKLVALSLDFGAVGLLTLTDEGIKVLDELKL